MINIDIIIQVAFMNAVDTPQSFPPGYHYFARRPSTTGVATSTIVSVAGQMATFAAGPPTDSYYDKSLDRRESQIGVEVERQKQATNKVLSPRRKQLYVHQHSRIRITSVLQFTIHTPSYYSIMCYWCSSSVHCCQIFNITFFIDNQ